MFRIPKLRAKTWAVGSGCCRCEGRRRTTEVGERGEAMCRRNGDEEFGGEKIGKVTAVFICCS